MVCVSEATSPVGAVARRVWCLLLPPKSTFGPARSACRPFLFTTDGTALRHDDNRFGF